MAWEKRGNRTYYYRVQRIEGKTIRTYFGSGDAARQAAQEDQAKKERAKARREDRRFSQIICEYTKLVGEFTCTKSNIELRSEGLHMSRGETRRFNKRTILPTIQETAAKLQALLAKQRALAEEAKALYESWLDRTFNESCAANGIPAKQQRANFEAHMERLFPLKKAPCATNEKAAKPCKNVPRPVQRGHSRGFMPLQSLPAPPTRRALDTQPTHRYPFAQC